MTRGGQGAAEGVGDEGCGRRGGRVGDGVGGRRGGMGER